MQQLKKTKERLLGKKGSKKDVKEQEEKLLKLPDIRSKGQTE